MVNNKNYATVEKSNQKWTLGNTQGYLDRMRKQNYSTHKQVPFKIKHVGYIKESPDHVGYRKKIDSKNVHRELLVVPVFRPHPYFHTPVLSLCCSPQSFPPKPRQQRRHRKVALGAGGNTTVNQQHPYTCG